MAAKLQLQNAGLTTLDLLDATVPKVQLTAYDRGGWVPNIAIPIYGRIPLPLTEILTLDVEGASHDAVATLMQGLHDYQRLSDEYIKDRTQEDPTWLYAQIANETGDRRALVRRIVSEWRTQHYGPSQVGMGDLVGNQAVCRIAIDREPFWERTSDRYTAEATPAAAISITFDPTATGTSHDIVGDVPARINYLNISPSNADELGRLWIGLRSANKHGTLANFVNVWELESGTLGTDAALAADATASPGGGGNTKVTITPGTATWAVRQTINLSDISVNESDNFGYFLWLLRTKVSAGTWEVQLRYGYSTMAAGDMIQGRIIEVDNTSWDIKEMDAQFIPLRDLQTVPTSLMADSSDAPFEIEVWARRTSGSGTLDLDCLCPIPLDEGWYKTWGFTITQTVAEHEDMLMFFTAPHEKTQTLTRRWADPTTSFRDFPPYAHNNFRLPIGDCRMIICYARETTSVLADKIEINILRYFERWLTLRGSE